MFRSNILVYVGNDRIWFGDLKGSNPKATAFKYNGGSIAPYLKKLSSKYKKRDIKIIAGESKSYSLVKNIIKNSQDSILSTAMSLIPENISSDNTKWKVLEVDTQKNSEKVEITTISSSIVEGVQELHKLDNISKEVAPISKLIAHVFRDEKKPLLCIWKGYETIAVVTFKGNVYLTSTTVTTKKGEINDIIEHVLEEFGLKIKHLVTNWKGTEKLIKLPKSWKYEFKNFDPIAEIEKMKSKDIQDYLFEVKKPEIKKRASYKEDEKKKKSSKSPLIYVFILFIILLLGGGGYYYWSKQGLPLDLISPGENSNIQELDESNNLEPDETVATESADIEINTDDRQIDLSNYSILVQNGSGTAGVAGETSEVLEEVGFVGIETENAESFEYTGLTILYKNNLDQSIVDIVTEAFSDSEISIDPILELDQDYDIILIVGS